MIKIIKYSQGLGRNKLISFLDQRRNLNNSETNLVNKIINDVKKNNFKALKKYEYKYSKNKEIKLSKKKINHSIKYLDKNVRKAIDYAYERILKFHKLQFKNFKKIKFIDQYKNKLEYKSVPIETVGVYVPGNLPSTLLMNCIPAKIAGVKRIVLATPKINNKLNPAVLYAAKKLGIKEILSMGGAQAIASLAFIQKVNKVVGPGNKYVAEAKRQLSGKILGTETMYAAASEICVLADKNTDLNQIATSLVSQAEHDPDAIPSLVTTSEALVAAVEDELKRQLPLLSTEVIAREALKNGGSILCQSMTEAIEVVNRIGPEHLELQGVEAEKAVAQLTSYGGLFIGEGAAEVFGDYGVGPNHVLPTSGTARYTGGLSVFNFIRVRTWLELSSPDGAEELLEDTVALAEAEGLSAHAASAAARRKV